MREAVHHATNAREPRTYFRGKLAIDGIWTTKDIEVSSAAYLPFDPELGDHRPVVANISKESLLGASGPRIALFAARKLNYKVERIRDKYNLRLEDQMRQHKILDRVTKLKKEAEGGFGEPSRKTLERLDIEITEMMMSAEKKCRKMYRGGYEFSPQVRFWIERGRAIKGLIRYKGKNVGNLGNVKQAARRCGIKAPLAINLGKLI